MNTTFDITPIVELVVTIASAIVTLYLIPYLKEKVSIERYERLKKWVSVAVQAAEQLYGSKTGQQKKEYAVSFLLAKGIVFNVDEVTAMIESEVYKLENSVEK